jgi:hypothetical protein
VTPRTSTRVAVDPLRTAFERSGLSASEVCRRLEWCGQRNKPDTTRLKRALGMKPSSSRGHRSWARVISIDRAALIADALDVDPWEVGL